MSHTSGHNTNRLPIALTMGEPSGVGPEITINLWKNRTSLNLPTFVYIGEESALKAYSDVPTVAITSASEAFDHFDSAIPCMSVGHDLAVEAGILNIGNAPAVISAIDIAVKLAKSGDVSSIVTNPINKASLYSAGFDAPGHTEYLARLCGEDDNSAVMMLTCDKLKVVPITIHNSVREITKYLSADLIEKKALITAHALRHNFGIASPRLAIAGLNPHAGEEGAMGLEEAAIIAPAIKRLQDAGIDAVGPLAADTMFHPEARANYDVALCMYHDQALIPVKTLDFYGGVNVTLGLPIIRTSPDHGTALDIAGQNIARPDSLLAAIRMAKTMSDNTNG